MVNKIIGFVSSLVVVAMMVGSYMLGVNDAHKRIEVSIKGHGGFEIMGKKYFVQPYDLKYHAETTIRPS